MTTKPTPMPINIHFPAVTTDAEANALVDDLEAAYAAGWNAAQRAAPTVPVRRGVQKSIIRNPATGRIESMIEEVVDLVTVVPGAGK